MKPQIAFILCLLFIFVIYKLEFNWRPNVSRDLWVPVIWLMIVGSRYLSYWLNLSDPLMTPEGVMEGSPFDRIVFLALNISGIYILYKRKIQLSNVINQNIWIFLLFLFGAISALWSEIPYVLIKRLFKSIGNPVMALVILSERDPLEALKTVFRRCSYVLFPFSIIFIKYYPDIGRAFSNDGHLMYTGVTGQKNDLGLICFIFNICFFWDIFKNLYKGFELKDRRVIIIDVICLCIGLWLLIKSDSATSLFCFIVGVILIVISEFSFIKNNVISVHILILISIILFFVFESLFNIKNVVIASLGRDSSLTDRVPLWEFLIAMGTNPIIGTGFESFWTANRIRLVQEIFNVSSVHNGYLDIYLNLGIIGLLIYTGIVVTTFKDTFRDMNINYDFSYFKIIFLIIILLYSYTEAYLTGINMIYFLFFFISMKLPSYVEDSYSPASIF